MKITVQSSLLVKPAEATWSGFIPLSELDQVSGNYFIPLLYVYKSPQNTLPARDEVFELLKQSLSKVLVPFYPLAGRLSQTPGGPLCIDCNAAGVQFVEAVSEAVWEDVVDADHNNLVPSLHDDGVPSLIDPLMGVKVTAFSCGTVSLGAAMWHPAADGLSATHFYNEWARIARGEALQSTPFISRKAMCAISEELDSFSPALMTTRPLEFDVPPTLINSGCEKEMKKPTIKTSVKLSKTQVETLKRLANKGINGTYKPGFSRFESITAHIWRCACRARGLTPEQETRLLTTVDIRQRMEPKLPKTFLGNAVLDVVVLEYAGDLMSKPLSYTTSRIREAVKKVTPEYINDTVCYLRSVDDLTSIHNKYTEFSGNPNLEVTSWLSLPFKGLDFGWGKEAYMAPISEKFDGDFLVTPGGHDGEGSVAIAMCLQEEHMESFRNFFYEDIKGV